MMVREIEVREYQLENGKIPFRAWVLALDKVSRARVQSRINRLETGNFGDAKNLGNGIWELRIFAGPGYRVYFGLEGTTVVLLLCGGDKSSQDLDIRRALKYWEKYQEEV